VTAQTAAGQRPRSGASRGGQARLERPGTNLLTRFMGCTPRERQYPRRAQLTPAGCPLRGHAANHGAACQVGSASRPIQAKLTPKPSGALRQQAAGHRGANRQHRARSGLRITERNSGEVIGDRPKKQPRKQSKQAAGDRSVSRGSRASCLRPAHPTARPTIIWQKENMQKLDRILTSNQPLGTHSCQPSHRCFRALEQHITNPGERAAPGEGNRDQRGE